MKERKETSYAKLKRKKEEEIRKLTNDIILLVCHENTEDAILTKLKWKIKIDIENQLMSGNP